MAEEHSIVYNKYHIFLSLISEHLVLVSTFATSTGINMRVLLSLQPSHLISPSLGWWVT